MSKPVVQRRAIARMIAIKPPQWKQVISVLQSIEYHPVHHHHQALTPKIINMTTTTTTTVAADTAPPAGMTKLLLRSYEGVSYRFVSTNPARDCTEDEIPIIDLQGMYGDIESRKKIARDLL